MTQERVRTETEGTAPEPAGEGSGPVAGSLWLDRYRVHGRAEGGFAFVAAVQDERTGRWFAVKIPKSPDSDLVEFRSEMGFWLELEPHQNIVRAFDVVEIEGRPALFLEYVGGHALNTLRARLSGEVPLETHEALACARQIARAMEFAGERGEVAHLDLKPENLMLTRGGAIKVTDFGLARRIAVVDGHYPKVADGSWPYVAPERFDRKPLDSRADIYAFGVILFEMITGRLPFALDFAGDVHYQMKAFHASGGLRTLTEQLFYTDRAGIAEQPVRQLISYCLQSYPGERPGSFRDVGAILDRIAPSAADDVQAEEQSLTADERVERAAALSRAGSADEALSLLNQLLVTEPDNPPLWRRIADVLESMGEVSEAESVRERI